MPQPPTRLWLLRARALLLSTVFSALLVKPRGFFRSGCRVSRDTIHNPGRKSNLRAIKNVAVKHGSTGSAAAAAVGAVAAVAVGVGVGAGVVVVVVVVVVVAVVVEGVGIGAGIGVGGAGGGGGGGARV